jgi:hypothetical protein
VSISVLQHKSNGFASNTSAALAFTGSVTSGSLIVVCVGTANGTTVTITDSQSNTYQQAVTKDPGATGTPAACWIFYTLATASNVLTVTSHLSAAHSIRMSIYEVSDVNTLDQTGTNFQSSAVTAATVSTSGATTNANEYVIAFFSQNNIASTSWTTGSGYSDGEIITTSSATDGFSEDAIVSSTGIQTATATASSADSITGVIATFYRAGDPTINSVPSGTPITAGSLSAKFLFFDTGDFDSGV